MHATQGMIRALCAASTVGAEVVTECTVHLFIYPPCCLHFSSDNSIVSYLKEFIGNAVHHSKAITSAGNVYSVNIFPKPLTGKMSFHRQFISRISTNVARPMPSLKDVFWFKILL